MASSVYSLSLNQTLPWKVRNFPDNVYNFNPTDNLTSLMSVLLGNAGTGQLNILQTAARLNQENFEFSDLDDILGTLLNTPRLVSEMYTLNCNPFTDQIPITNWQDVISKDSSYRERLIGITASLLKGATPFGMTSSAEATSGMQFRTIEVWSTTLSGTTISGTSITTRGFGNNETVLLPLVPPDLTFTTELKHDVLKSANNLKPVGNIVTVASGISPYSKITYTVVSGNSEFFYLNRQVTGNNINIPQYASSSSDLTITGRYFLRNNQTTSAPQFAHLLTEEISIDTTLNISTVEVTPLSSTSSTGQLASYSTNTPLGSPTLGITSTVYGNS